MKAFWKSAPLWIKGLVAIIVVLTVFAAIAPSSKQRAINAFKRAPDSVMDTLLKAGALKTYEIKPEKPLGEVIFVWDANMKGTYKANFHEYDIEGFDVWELPINGEKQLPVIDAIHQITTNPPRKSLFNGTYRSVATPYAYNIPKSKLPNALERKRAKQLAIELTKQFGETGLSRPVESIAYVRIPGQKTLFIAEDSSALRELRNLFSIPQ